MIGGNGSDYLQGGVGADRYVLSGEGIDLINPWQGSRGWSGIHTDVIELPEGVTFDMLTTQYGKAFYYDGQMINSPATLNLNWLGATHAMVVLPFTLPDYGYSSDSFDQVVLRFADGTTVAMETLLANTQAEDSRPFIWSNPISYNDDGREWRIPLAAVEFRVGMGEVSTSDYPGGLIFAENISPDEVNYLKSGNDLLVTLTSGTDSLRLQDWYLRSDEPEAAFADGQVLSYWDLSDRGTTLTGTDGNDNLIAADDYGWYVQGLAGNDVLQGNTGPDALEGDEGNDTLIGGIGDDYLDGGAGNDTLAGETGSDHYYFGHGSGADTISDQTISGSGDVNTVIIDYGVRPEDIIVNSDGSHIILSIVGTDDKLTLQWDKQNGYFVQQIEFADGTVWEAAMLESMAIPFNNAPILINPISDQNGVENHPFSFEISADTFLIPI